MERRKAAVASAAATAAVVTLGAFWPVPASPAAGSAPAAGGAGGRTPVLVELFTSEGCSSCPPAEALLARLQATQPVPGAQIIALGEHVDYWDRLGWKDPYSSAASSSRQGEYAAALRGGEVYTPQMVVGGRDGFVGSDESAARAAVARDAARARATVDVTPSPRGGFAVRVSALPPGSGPADVYAAVTQGGLTSNVARGENAGRRLTHAAVVRRLERIGSVAPAGTFSGRFAAGAPRGGGDVRVVAFVQERGTRHVLGAAERPAGE